jgi:DNA-binding beta-propeller fold protein YncE
MQVVALSVATGAIIYTAKAPDPWFLAADPGAGAVYVANGQGDSPRYSVIRYQWDGVQLARREAIDDPALEAEGHPITVMPAVCARNGRDAHPSCLVIGTYCRSVIHVFELPSHDKLYSYTLTGIDVIGLAADPHGSAIIVCDNNTEATLALEWPLSKSLA